MKRIDINTTKRVVYGEGDKNAKILIVGEAPGAREDRVGKPFKGKAGQLLNKMLRKAGILRQACWITNVVKEKPPGNNIDKFIEIKKGSVYPTSEYKKYEDYLYDEIRDIDPNIIVPTGATALWAVCREKGITKWRGSVIDSIVDRPDGNGKYKALPVLHPASAFRQYIWQHYIAFDLKKVRKKKDSPDIKRKDRQYILRPDFHQVMSYLEDCKNKDRHAFDIEVSGKEVSCISFAKDTKSAISIPFRDRGREYFGIEQEAEIWESIGELLEGPVASIAHNATFDATFLFRKYGIKTDNIHDTMVAHAILYPEFKKGLGFITSIYTDIPYYKDEGKENFNKDYDTFNQSFWLYNAKDSIVLMEALPKMMKELQEQGNLETYEDQIKLIEPLLFMTGKGIKMDVKGLEAQSSLYEAKIARLETELNQEVGYQINPRSPKQLKEYFYGELGIKPYTNNGNPTTDESAMIRLARGTKSRNPIKAADLVLELRSLNKMKGTYLDMKLDEDGRLRSSFNPVGTKTGRLSSSKTIFGTGANLQNQPPMMKTFMLADEDHIAYEIDLGQADNRVVAYIAPEPKMIEAFENNIDIHSRTASYIFDMPEDQIAQMDEEGVMCETIGKGDYSHRYWGKKANHAFNYKQGYKKFAYQVEIPENQGKFIHNQYHSVYPGIRKYHNWIEEELKSSRSLTNLFGRRYMFLDRWGYHLISEGTAFIPQSTVADIINRWGLLPVYYNQEEYKEVLLLNQIHDSIVNQIKLEDNNFERHAEILLNISESMEQTLEFRGREFSIPCDLSIYPVNLKEGPEIEDVTKYHQHELASIIEETYYGQIE